MSKKIASKFVSGKSATSYPALQQRSLKDRQKRRYRAYASCHLTERLARVYRYRGQQS